MNEKDLNAKEIFGNLDETGWLTTLKKVSKIDEFGKYPKVKELLAEGYGSDYPFKKRITTILNSIFTQKQQTFIISRNVLYGLLVADVQVDGPKLHTTEYKVFLAQMLSCGWFVRLREPTSRKGGVYKLVEPNIIKILWLIKAEEYFSEQERYVLSYYDSSDLGEKE